MLAVAFVVVALGLFLFDRPNRKPDQAGADPADLASLITDCKRYVKSVASHPSTVDFHLLSSSSKSLPDGTQAYVTQASMKNSFGLAITYDVVCTRNAKGELETMMREAK